MRRALMIAAVAAVLVPRGGEAQTIIYPHFPSLQGNEEIPLAYPSTLGPFYTTPTQLATFIGSAGVTVPGSAGAIQTTDGAGHFGTPINPATGMGTFLSSPSSATLRAVLGDGVGTGAAYFVGGALGQPASADLTNATHLPIATGVDGLGTNVAIWLGTPSSANLAAALTTKTGTGNAVFGTGPSLSALILSDTAGSGIQCLHVSNTGLVSATGTGDCGSGSPGSLSITDGTHTVTGTTGLTVGAGFVVSGTTPNATLNTTQTITSSASATYTLQGSDAGTIAHLTNAAPAVTVQAAATLGNGYGANVQCDNACTLTPASGTINGAGSLVLAARQTGVIWTDGSALSGGVLPATDPSNATNLTSGTVAAARGGAGTVSGVMKANGSGTVSAAVAGTDYAAAPSGTSGTPLFNNGSGGFTNGTVSGTGTKLGTVTGTPTSGNCVSWSSGNLADAGGPCTTGGGGGTVSSGTANQIAYYASTGTTVTGDANLTDNGSVLTVGKAFSLSASIAPTALAGNQNDWNPTGLGTTVTIRVDPGTADRIITGLTAQASGTIARFVNIGTHNILFSNADGGSSAANQFCFAASVTLIPNRPLAVQYDGISTCWRQFTAGGVSYSPAPIGWISGAVPSILTVFTATQPATVIDITGTVETATGGTATLSFYKTPNGTVCGAAGSTILHTGSFNANGTASTNQTLTLSATASDLILAAGDRVCAVVSGAGWTSTHTGNGGVTVKVGM